MAPVDLPYLLIFRAGGRQVAYYRRDGAKTRLRHEDGRPVDPADATAIAAAWQREHEHREAIRQRAESAAAARVVRPGSIADLIARYRASSEWLTQRKPATKADYEKALRPLEHDFGELLVKGLKRQYVTKIRDRYATRSLRNKAGEPILDAQGQEQRVPNARQANRVVTVLSILLSYAVDPLDWRPDNPALRPKRLRTEGEGYAPWLPWQFQQFMQRSGAEWQFAALLALLTAQRGQDQVRMRLTDYDPAGAGRIHVVQLKGRKRVKLWVTCHPLLRAALDERKATLAALKTSPLTWLHRDGAEWPVNAFQKAAGQAIRAAGLQGVVWHGLRGTAASWASEGGASLDAVMKLLGHSTPRMSLHYSRGAAQERLAAQAIAAITVPDWKEGEGTP